MNQDDRDRLIRIETLLTSSVVPRLDSHGEKLEKHDGRLKVVEKVALTATVMWGGACLIAYVAKDAAAEWFKRRIMGHP